MSLLRAFPLSLLLIVTTHKILTPASVPENLLLGKHHAGELKVGMAENEIYKAWPRTLTRKVMTYPEGIETSAVQIFMSRDQQTPELVAVLNGDRIYGIEVRGPRFRTAQGIGVGSTIADLRKTGLRFRFNREEGNGLICDEIGMKFAVDVDPATDLRLEGHEADPLAIIPPAVKIHSIWI